MAENKEDCSSCEDVRSSDKEPWSKSRYKLKPELKEKLTEIPEVLDFIEMLQRYIEKQKKKLKKWKSKLKKNKCLKDASSQTNNEAIDVEFNNHSEEPKAEAKCIAQDIKEAAEMAVKNSGFVYEETSGMYYDYNTGYYYNAEYGLYYDGNTGTYMKYNQSTQAYEFHSQISRIQRVEAQVPQQVEEKEKIKTKRKKRIGINTKEQKRARSESGSPENSGDIEEGECSESCDSDVVSEEDRNSDTSEVSKQWPPCMRIIIEESAVPKIKVGSLHIITYEGGSIGREGDHSLLIPDVNISKHHLRVSFDKETSRYLVTDLGSRNGTLLNNKRISPAKQESEPYEVTHGSKIQIGSTVLLCHIHDGSQTCGHCEPGLLQFKDPLPQKLNKTSKSERHKMELQNLRKKFGVANLEEDSKLASGYTDRAQKRRDTVGSQNPHEKTQVASLNESITSENKGFKLLSKMGWKEGQSLGKEGQGMLEPVKLISNQGKAGIGSAPLDVPESVPGSDAKQNIWKKTQERFEKLPDVKDAFEPEND